MTNRIAIVLIGAFLVAVTPAIAADEPGITRARLDLDRAESMSAKLAKGDIPAAKKAMALVSKAKKSLLSCKDRKAPAWITQAKRARALDTKIRTIAGVPQASKPPKADAAALKATSLLGEIARELPKLPPGDVKAGNALIKRLNAAATVLKSSKTRNSKEWQDSAKRYADLNEAIRERIAEKPAEGSVKADAAALQAKKMVDEVAKGVSQLKAGDRKTGGALISKLIAASKELKKSKTGAAKEWQEARKRMGELDAAIRKRIAEKPKPGAIPIPKLNPPSELGPRALDVGPEPADKPRLSGTSAGKYRVQFQRAWKQKERELLRADPLAIVRDRFLRPKFESVIKRHRGIIKELSPQSHPRVQWAYKKVAAYERLLAAKVRAGQIRDKEIKAEIAQVDKELKEMESFFDAKNFRCDLRPPYSEEKVLAWATELKSYSVIKGKGLAQIDNFVKERPKYAGLGRIKRLRQFFEKGLDQKVQAGIKVTLGYPGGRASPIAGDISKGESFLTFTKDGFQDKHLADDKWVRDSLKTMNKAIHAGRMKNVFNKTYKGKADPKLDVFVKGCLGRRQKLEGSATKLLAETRMPKAATSSSALMAIVRKALKDPKRGVKSYKRIVIYKDKQNFKEPKSASRPEGNYIRIWKWTEEWQTFEACVAEEREGGYRLVYYTLKYISRGPSWKKDYLREWYVSQQSVDRRILEENIDK